MQKLFKNQVMQQLEKFPKLVRLELKKKLGTSLLIQALLHGASIRAKYRG